MQDNNDNRRKVLVIEDEPVIRRVCLKTLTREGFDVDLAANGLIAKDMSAKKVYDLYLSDIRTPGMNGMEFYRYLRTEHPELADRVIFTTGDVLNSEVKEFLQDLSAPFLPKPFTPEELKILVSKVVD